MPQDFEHGFDALHVVAHIEDEVRLAILNLLHPTRLFVEAFFFCNWRFEIVLSQLLCYLAVYGLIPRSDQIQRSYLLELAREHLSCELCGLIMVDSGPNNTKSSAMLDNAHFFCLDLRQRVAEYILVVCTYAGYCYVLSLTNVSRIEAPSYANLEDGHVDLLSTEVQETHHCYYLKESYVELVQVFRGNYLVNIVYNVTRADHLLIYSNTLSKATNVRRGKKACL